jgi:hypothetical protein
MPRGITTDTIGRAALGVDFIVALILVGSGGREVFAFWAGAFLDFTTATEHSFKRCFLIQARAFPHVPGRHYILKIRPCPPAHRRRGHTDLYQ